MKEKIANALSLTNLSLGFLSIFLSIQGMFNYAAYMIIAAVAVDALDGTIARLLKIDSVFGKELDNISDLVSSAIAPGIFVYLILYEQLIPPLAYILLFLILVLVLSGVVRTAKLNSGRSTKWHGMMVTFNVIIPILYVLNFFSAFIILGWLMISPVLMLSKFNLGGSLRKRKKESVPELKSDMAEVDEEDYAEKRRKRRKRRKKKEEPELVPLAIFGD